MKLFLCHSLVRSEGGAAITEAEIEVNLCCSNYQ